MSKKLTIDDFGKDHWSLLAYVECLCVDKNDEWGEIRRDRMRCNRETHRHLLGPQQKISELPWNPGNGTRLSGYSNHCRFDEKDSRHLPNHDDWNCLRDLEEHGFVEVMSIINGFVAITENGLYMANEIRKYKVKGGSFSTFVPPVIAY